MVAHPVAHILQNHPQVIERIAGQQPLMIEQQVQLHRAFAAPVLGPVEDRGAPRNEASVEREQFAFEAEAMAPGHLATAVLWFTSFQRKP